MRSCWEWEETEETRRLRLSPGAQEHVKVRKKRRIGWREDKVRQEGEWKECGMVQKRRAKCAPWNRQCQQLLRSWVRWELRSIVTFDQMHWWSCQAIGGWPCCTVEVKICLVCKCPFILWIPHPMPPLICTDSSHVWNGAIKRVMEPNHVYLMLRVTRPRRTTTWNPEDTTWA